MLQKLFLFCITEYREKYGGHTFKKISWNTGISLRNDIKETIKASGKLTKARKDQPNEKAVYRINLNWVQGFKREIMRNGGNLLRTGILVLTFVMMMKIDLCFQKEYKLNKVSILSITFYRSFIVMFRMNLNYWKVYYGVFSAKRIWN